MEFQEAANFCLEKNEELYRRLASGTASEREVVEENTQAAWTTEPPTVPGYYWFRQVRDGVAGTPDILWLIEPEHAESFSYHSFHQEPGQAREILGYYEYWSERIPEPVA